MRTQLEARRQQGQGDTAKQLRYKRPFDLVVLAGTHLFPPLLPVWALLWLLIPLAIWLDDRGPVLYRQRRYGRNGREFTFLKFRTMTTDADAAGLVTGEHDPRVTRVGRFLRRTALDELPQVINILRGNMSFVGPRALPLKMHEDATREEPRFPERLDIIPGLTGVAQLYLPRHCHPKRRLRYDLVYIREASLWLDVRLMLRAAWNTLTGSWGTGPRRIEPGVGVEPKSARED